MPDNQSISKSRMAITAILNSREISETSANATACPDIVVGAAAADAGDPLDRPTLPAGKDVGEDIVATWNLAAAVFAFREDETDTANWQISIRKVSKPCHSLLSLSKPGHPVVI